MRNFFYRVSGAIARFMYGRNGTDQLTRCRCQTTAKRFLTGYHQLRNFAFSAWRLGRFRENSLLIHIWTIYYT